MEGGHENGNGQISPKPEVFVTLKGVLELQDLFRLVSGRTRATTQEKDDLAFQRGEAYGLSEAIKMLDLPICDI